MDIADEFGLKLKRTGRSYMGLCPFHSEKTPSFSINPEKNIFKCFGCGVGGDAIALYAKLNNISNGQAISRLGKRLGLSNSKPLPEPIVRKYAKKKQDKSLEKRFLTLYKQAFNDLCSIRDVMNNLAKEYSIMIEIELDELLVQYYHERAYIQHLIDTLYDGLIEKISFEEQIESFSAAKEVVKKWVKLLQKRLETQKA